MAEMMEKIEENVLPVFLEENYNFLMFQVYFFQVLGFFFLREKTRNFVKNLVFQNWVNLNFGELLSLKWKPQYAFKDKGKKGALL